MKNKDFFYLQYNKIDWKNQEKTKINSFINNYIIRNIISNHKGNDISIFDIGFGIGFFFKMLLSEIEGKYKNILIEGCEPSRVNYDYFLKKKPKGLPTGITINTYKNTFQDIETNNKFDFITAIYVFPHFLSEDLESVVKKVYSMLKNGGKFILVLAKEKYLENKLETEQDLFIEKRNIAYNGKQFKELLHYSDIPKIGKIVDYNREEAYYLDLFQNNNFKVSQKENLEDNGFVCTLFVFEK
ncbi:MAG TPA: class I SAM-dependent methyltransferase [Candidatus Paceibacterota bacterium]|nr:class I SAM-dependent methyltransferase [Candidatus Paceibacterota bacterium]